MIVVFGGYGVFGSHAARFLAASGLPVRIAGRDAVRAERFAASLGESHEGIAADIGDPASCARALQGATGATIGFYSLWTVLVSHELRRHGEPRR